MVLLGLARLVVLEGFLDHGAAPAVGDSQGEARVILGDAGGSVTLE
jgi:hypothetical protein